MNSILNELGYYNSSNYNDILVENILKYSLNNKVLKINNTDKEYFLNNDTWNSKIIIEKLNLNNQAAINGELCFHLKNTTIKNEMKILILEKLSSDDWSIKYLFGNFKYKFNYFSIFLNDKYKEYLSDSILSLNKNELEFKWINFLELNNLKTTTLRATSFKEVGKIIHGKNSIALFSSYIHESIFNVIDNRNEFEKDIWDIRKLKQYSIRNNSLTTAQYNLRFDYINNTKIKNEVKKVFKKRLLTQNKFTWNTAKNHLLFVSKFINFITEIEPSWTTLKKLDRVHIEQYIEFINEYSKTNLSNKISNPENYLTQALMYVNNFLTYIQVREYDIAPVKDVRRLIFKDDKPTELAKDSNKISYIPDFILDQLFKYINELPKTVIPIIIIMYKTGLRISDVLLLKTNCLIKINNSYWIETNITKTYVKNHRIPIDLELARIIATLVDKSFESNVNNSSTYIFASKNGRPPTKRWIQQELNILAQKYNIVDEKGNIYRFKNHAFRHTFGVKLLNNGVDILTVQELLAHASPEMTMRYAKLLDDTKRKTFDNAVKQGVFSFAESSKLKEENNGEISTDVLNMLWTNHKLNAIDTPYGTCLQRTNGKCSFAKQPPCLTCNSGNPCRDLCVGAFEGDIQKYEILINSTKSMIENAKIYDRKEMAKENEELLNLYEDIYSKICEGNIIYSRLDRLKKTGDINE